MLNNRGLRNAKFCSLKSKKIGKLIKLVEEKRKGTNKH